MRRIVILGTSGAGKSTVARAVAAAHHLPHVDLDDLTTGMYPPVTGEAFTSRVREVVEQPNWIIDGDYHRTLGNLVLSRAEVAVWLDLPLRVSLVRMWRRTSHDVRTGARPFHPALARWLAHEIHSHLRRRFTMRRRLSAHLNLRVVHLRTQREVDAWLAPQPAAGLVTCPDASRSSLPPKATPRYAGTILWDFDGTLVWRPSMWSRALNHALTDFGLEATITSADVESWFESGFPWQRLEHPELSTADKWWGEVTDRIVALVSAAKVPRSVAIEIAAAVRRAIVSPTDYRVFDDVIPTLRLLGYHGLRHVIASNHIPELEDLVVALGLGTLFEAVVTSGRVGYEKPDPRLFMVALEGIDRVGPIWSVGDSVTRDCIPARDLGIDALLVRTADDGYRPRAADLNLAAKIIVQELG